MMIHPLSKVTAWKHSGLALAFLLAWVTTHAATGDVTLEWTYSSPLSTNVTFVLRSSPVLNTNLIAWPILTNIVGTSTSVTVRIVPGERFFVMQSSNLWGLSDFSNVAQTPALPVPPLLSIKAAQ